MIVIIGNGISGVTAARHIRKNSNEEITIISSESKYFFSRTALMYVYMGHMKFEHTQPYEAHFWEKNRINLVEDFILKIDTENKILIYQEILGSIFLSVKNYFGMVFYLMKTQNSL